MDKPLKDILREQMQAKGLTFERLKIQTGIAERYLAAFLEGQNEKLPAVPYVRGYLMTIAAVLELNGNELWETHKESFLAKKSGPADRLPHNRFAIKTINKNWIIAVVLAALLIFYVILNIDSLLSGPKIKITSPSGQTLITANKTVQLIGSVDPGAKLLIGSEEVIVDADGQFQKNYSLQFGLNSIEFSAKKILGRETKITRQVIYQP